jgi:hypothetical protein
VAEAMSRHDLFLVGLQAHEQRMTDWRDREITPRWIDRLIVGGALFVIVFAAVLR